MPPEETPGLSELARNFADFRQEYRADRNLFVRSDLYQTERSFLMAELAGVKAEQDASRKEAVQRWSSLTNSIRAGLISSAFAVVVALIVAWIK